MIGQGAARGVDRRFLLAGAGLAGVLLGLLLLFTVFGGGGSDGELGLSSAPPASTPPATDGTKLSGAGVDVDGVIAAGRDPFDQVTGPGQQPAVGEQARPLSSQPPAPGGEQPSGAQPAGGDYASLELLSISKDDAGVERAHVTVDGKPYQPAVGEVFSYGFRLERIDGNCIEVSAEQERVDLCAPPREAPKP